MNKKIVNFENLKNEQQDLKAKKVYTLGDYYDYKNNIADYVQKVGNLYNKTQNEKYLGELRNCLVDFYNAVFNVCNKQWQLLQENHQNIESGLVYFLPRIEELYNNIINLKSVRNYNMNFLEVEKLRKSEKCYKNSFTIEDYKMQMNSIDKYIMDLTVLSKNPDAKMFCASEQFNIIDKCYNIFNRILEEFIKQVEEQHDFTNEASIYLMMVEYEKISKNLPNPDNYNEEIDNNKVIKLKKD